MGCHRRNHRRRIGSFQRDAGVVQFLTPGLSESRIFLGGYRRRRSWRRRWRRNFRRLWLGGTRFGQPGTLRRVQEGAIMERLCFMRRIFCNLCHGFEVSVLIVGDLFEDRLPQ